MYTKVIRTKKIIQVFQYEHLNVRGGNKVKSLLSSRDDLEAYKEQNYAKTQRYRRKSILNLICNNFDNQNAKFVTLTFDNKRDFDIKDVKQCNAYFKAFIKRLRYVYGDFKYLYVIEFQDSRGRGAVHYHVIMEVPFIKKSELARIWGGGFVKINAIDKVDNLGAYVVKYMNKDIDDKRLQGLKAYGHSRNLEQPNEFKSWDVQDKSDVEAVLEKLQSSYMPCYQKSYETEKCGLIIYRQYNLNRKECYCLQDTR